MSNDYHHFCRDLKGKGKWHVNTVKAESKMILPMCKKTKSLRDVMTAQSAFKNTELTFILPDDAKVCRKCLKILVNSSIGFKFHPSNEKHLYFNNKRYVCG